ncbi:hypothetical protein TSUD_395280 [Trifolium subterraneum]|uniref:Selenoprotein O n=1 Tax=Trifolium subterraneum TaxID=3900 RepID=A0A2Z6N017_TRISU|nr:hypothetical protein TSUD_395280 [Trifolium subterraneum]
MILLFYQVVLCSVLRWTSIWYLGWPVRCWEDSLQSFCQCLIVLRSSIREFLCSEAMHHLGIPTIRALCLVNTGKLVT